MITQQTALSAAERIGTVTQVYDGALTSDLQVNTFRHIDRLFPVRVVKHGTSVLALGRGDKPLTHLEFTSGGKLFDLIDYMALNRVTALLMLKDGKIAYEDYEMGNTEHTRWMSMSMVKSITSSLVGAAIQDGHIKSIDDPVTEYVAQLRGSAYEGVSIRYLLQMASGVKWDETYTNPASDRRRMLQAQIAQQPGAIMNLMARLPRMGAPGTIWNYSTGETFVAGAVVRAAVEGPGRRQPQNDRRTSSRLRLHDMAHPREPRMHQLRRISSVGHLRPAYLREPERTRRHSRLERLAQAHGKRGHF